ncbi:unnamed protein product, partial [Allacma fusca]
AVPSSAEGPPRGLSAIFYVCRVVYWFVNSVILDLIAAVISRSMHVSCFQIISAAVIPGLKIISLAATCHIVQSRYEYCRQPIVTPVPMPPPQWAGASVEDEGWAKVLWPLPKEEPGRSQLPAPPFSEGPGEPISPTPVQLAANEGLNNNQQDPGNEQGPADPFDEEIEQMLLE